jgi:hypothetical protein
VNKEDLIKQCRYYNGQDDNPFTDGEIAWFWDMERVYVAHHGNFIGEAETYKRIHGRKYMGIPYNLLMVMFTSWAKYATNIEESIEGFYSLMELYLDSVSDHISKDKIPNT